MSDPQGTPANDPWAPQSPSQQNPAQGSVPSTPQVPQAAEAAQPAQQPWGAPQAPAQPQQPWGAAPQACSSMAGSPRTGRNRVDRCPARYYSPASSHRWRDPDRRFPGGSR